MIAVIADDLTGAAELAGIGLNYRLKTEIDTVVDPNSEADLLIIATDTRSMPVEEAKQVITDITLQLNKLQPKLIFKKIDSVLRGNVLAEINSQLEASGLKRALIVPGNPLHGKTVVDGVYYYKNKPVHLSNYSHDPGFPVRSSDVKKMLRANGNIQLLKKHQELPATGVILGEAAAEADLNRWVEKAGDQTLIAGAAGLFNSLLNFLRPVPSDTFRAERELQVPRLFIFGSTFKKERDKIKEGQLNNVPVLYLTEELIFDEDDSSATAGYIELVISHLKNNACIIAVHPDAGTERTIDPELLTKKMGFVVSTISRQIALRELLIEGGATAAAILQQLDITRLNPVKQMAPGVITTCIPGNDQLSVTLKPGSYEWPSAVWEPTN